MLFVSELPAILANSLFNQSPAWLEWAKVSILALFALTCWSWKRLRQLWPLAVVMFVFRLVFTLTLWMRESDGWKETFAFHEVSFAVNNAGIFILDSLIALAVIVTLWILKRHRSEFFLVKGQTDAPIEPVRWLGIGKGESWRVFGWIFAIAATIFVSIPTFLSLGVTSDSFLKAIHLFPAAILCAAVNAFNEEIYFRASLFATLVQVIGKTQAMWINVVVFGLAHFIDGSPPGIVGAAMAGFLAFLIGKGMLETKGLFWAWLIHFLPDVVIFISYTFSWVD